MAKLYSANEKLVSPSIHMGPMTEKAGHIRVTMSLVSPSFTITWNLITFLAALAKDKNISIAHSLKLHLAPQKMLILAAENKQCTKNI